MDRGRDGSEVWKSDGTFAGTSQVLDIRPGPSGSSPIGFVVAGGRLFFAANDTTANQELWKSDGPTTVQIADINPGAGNAEISSLHEYDGFLYFIADDGTYGRELWGTDGSTGGEFLLAEVRAGAPNGVGFAPGFTELDGLVFFPADDGVDGDELWGAVPSAPPVPSVSTPGAMLMVAALALVAASRLRRRSGAVEGTP